LPYTLPATEVSGNPQDKRELGLAVSRIDVFPLNRSMFTAQKYNDPLPFDGLNYFQYNPGVRDAVIHGAYTSAYDYFIKHNRSGEEASFELHEKFDECPGDLYDILKDDIQNQCRNLEIKFQDEITIIRNMIYRQGDMIREIIKYNAAPERTESDKQNK
jgi:hypothetical protein